MGASLKSLQVKFINKNTANDRWYIFSFRTVAIMKVSTDI